MSIRLKHRQAWRRPADIYLLSKKHAIWVIVKNACIYGTKTFVEHGK